MSNPTCPGGLYYTYSVEEPEPSIMFAENMPPGTFGRLVPSGTLVYRTEHALVSFVSPRYKGDSPETRYGLRVRLLPPGSEVTIAITDQPNPQEST